MKIRVRMWCTGQYIDDLLGLAQIRAAPRVVAPVPPPLRPAPSNVIEAINLAA